MIQLNINILYIQYLRGQPIRWGNRPAEGGNPTPIAQADLIKERNAHCTDGEVPTTANINTKSFSYLMISSGTLCQIYVIK